MSHPQPYKFKGREAEYRKQWYADHKANIEQYRSLKCCKAAVAVYNHDYYLTRTIKKRAEKYKYVCNDCQKLFIELELTQFYDDENKEIGEPVLVCPRCYSENWRKKI